MTVTTFGLHSVFHDWSSLCQHSKSWTLLVSIYFGASRLHCSCCRGRVIQAEKKRLQLLLDNFRKINSGETNSQAFRQHLPTSSNIFRHLLGPQDELGWTGRGEDSSGRGRWACQHWWKWQSLITSGHFGMVPCAIRVSPWAGRQI